MVQWTVLGNCNNTWKHNTYHGTWKWKRPSKIPHRTICRAVKPPPQNIPTPTHSTIVAANDTNGNRAIILAQRPTMVNQRQNHEYAGYNISWHDFPRNTLLAAEVTPKIHISIHSNNLWQIFREEIITQVSLFFPLIRVPRAERTISECKLNIQVQTESTVTHLERKCYFPSAQTGS